jgi:putative endopeptidase
MTATHRPHRARAGAAIIALVAWSLIRLSLGFESAARAEPAVFAGMDPTVAPGDDFFAYANGGWLKAAEIPSDRASYGVGAMLAELTDKRNAELIQQVGDSHPRAGSETRKIADYYASFMDEAGIESRGVAPLKPELARIAAISSRKSLAAVLGATLRADVDILNATNLHTERLFGLWVSQDLDDPRHYSPFLVQGGLGLPDRDYYLDPSPRMAEIQAKYRAHIAAVLELAGVTDAEAKAARIFDLELAIARTHVSRADTEQVQAGDNHWTRADFRVRARGLDWDAYFGAAGLAGQRRLVVWQPAAVTGISALVAARPVEDWKDYLVFHAIERASPVLPKAFVDERFAFYGKVLSGAPALSARWKRGVALTNAALGDAVGKLYAARYFPPEAKARLQVTVQNLLAAYRHRIDALDWMAPATKARAQAKLAALRIGVGYPDRWRDYRGLRIVLGDAYGDWSRAGLFDYRQNLRKLARPVDRGEWVMTPQTVNAVNLPAMNALNFPAAYLQPPLFDPQSPPAMNYGAVGATIGHEISHSFDDQGALFDASGRLSNWWTKEDFAHFQASAAQLARQYDAYRPFPDLAVNGQQTLSENIADVAGLAAAFDAFKLSLDGKPAPVIAGFTGDQQFFIAFAQSWRSKVREAALRQQIHTDGHAPSEYRADTVRNIDGWYQAFSPTPGQRLYLAPADRVKMW